MNDRGITETKPLGGLENKDATGLGQVKREEVVGSPSTAPWASNPTAGTPES